MSDHAQTEAEIIGSGRITIGTRRQYAEQSLQWKNDEGRTEDQHLQRIWNLANDTLALIDYIHALVAERDEARRETERWLSWSEGQSPDDSPGDVIAIYEDGTIILDDSVTTWNPLRALGFSMACVEAAEAALAEARRIADAERTARKATEELNVERAVRERSNLEAIAESERARAEAAEADRDTLAAALLAIDDEIQMHAGSLDPESWVSHIGKIVRAALASTTQDSRCGGNAQSPPKGV